MQIYFAGNGQHSDDLIVEYKQLRLQSFAYPKDVARWWNVSNDQPIFLDSGAFTAFMQKTQIDIDKYIAFIHENKHRCRVYAVLDVIGDYRGTKDNLKYMESNGLKPLPVYHVGSPKEELIYLINNYEYFALGGLVPYAKDRKFLTEWFDYVFAYTKADVRLHGFGMNAVWLWEKYPFYSVDATSWLSPVRYGGLEFNGKKYERSTKSVIGMKLNTEHYSSIMRLSLIDYMRKAERITKLWKMRGIEWKDHYVANQS